MNKASILSPLAAAFVVAACAASSRAAEEPAPSAQPPTREALRDELRNLPPEERRARLQKLREQFGTNAPRGGDSARPEDRPGFKRGEPPPREKLLEEREQFRSELMKLPPEERVRRMMEWRERHGANPAPPALSPDEREAKRKEIRQRVDSQAAALRKKKTDGSITEEETQRLERMEQMLKRMDAQKDAPLRPLPPADRPLRPGKPLDKPAAQ